MELMFIINSNMRLEIREKKAKKETRKLNKSIFLSLY